MGVIKLRKSDWKIIVYRYHYVICYEKNFAKFTIHILSEDSRENLKSLIEYFTNKNRKFLKQNIIVNQFM